MDRVVIAGGDVVDGTGAPAVAADVALEGDRIVEIGPNLRGDRRIDAAGCAVAPGFVDIHTHYDAQVFWDPALDAILLSRCDHRGGRQLRLQHRAGPPRRSRGAEPHDGEGRGHGSRLPHRRRPVG